MRYLCLIILMTIGVRGAAQEKHVFVFNKNDTTNVIEEKNNSKRLFILDDNLSFIYDPKEEISKTISYDSISDQVMTPQEYYKLGAKQTKKIIEEAQFFLFVREKPSDKLGCLYEVEYAITIRDPIFD